MWMLKKPDGDMHGMDPERAASFFFVFWMGWFAWRYMAFAWYGTRIQDILPPGWNW